MNPCSAAECDFCYLYKEYGGDDGFGLVEGETCL